MASTRSPGIPYQPPEPLWEIGTMAGCPAGRLRLSFAEETWRDSSRGLPPGDPLLHGLQKLVIPKSKRMPWTSGKACWSSPIWLPTWPWSSASVVHYPGLYRDQHAGRTRTLRLGHGHSEGLWEHSQRSNQVAFKEVRCTASHCELLAQFPGQHHQVLFAAWGGGTAHA